MTSILETIKKMLGADKNYFPFDEDIIVHINSAFMALNQLGVGPEKCFAITNYEQTWEDFLGDSLDYEACKSYIYFRVKLAFDPPTNSFVVDAINKQLEEYAWRLTAQADERRKDDEPDNSS